MMEEQKVEKKQTAALESNELVKQLCKMNSERGTWKQKLEIISELIH